MLMLPVLTMGHNTVMELISQLAIQTEMSCCAEETPEPACCCSAESDGATDCQSGNCESSHCLMSVASSVFIAQNLHSNFVGDDVLNKKIQSVLPSYLPADPGSIWTPPKIVS